MIRRSILASLFLLAAVACSPPAPATAQPQTPPTGAVEEAVFAGGCFWCMETDMGAIPGVISVESGYTGGALENPSYEDVLTETTGHFEAVRVRYDSGRITYRQVLDRYWPLVDPTDDGGQFCDRGPSYRTAIFVTPAQRAEAEASKRAIIASGRVNGRVLTPVLDAVTFWPAEEYHRNYARRNPVHYAAYRAGCGRDRVLRQVWRR